MYYNYIEQFAKLRKNGTAFPRRTRPVKPYGEILMTKKLSAEEVEEVDPALAEQEKEKKKNKSRKVIVTTTYFITILCL